MKSQTKSTLMFIVLVVFLALVAYLVFAAVGTGKDLRIDSPASYTNFSANFIINVTFNSSKSGGVRFFQNPGSLSALLNYSQNTSCYINMSGKWSKIGTVVAGGATGKIKNTTAYKLERNWTTSSTQRLSVGVDLSNITDGRGYAINCTLGNTTQFSLMNITNLSRGITIDDTIPAITITNPTPTSGHNYSEAHGGLMVVNATIIDAGVNMSRGSVFFNFTKAKVQIATVRARREGVRNYYSNSTINTTTLADGIYNITVYANDSLNNLNNSFTSYRRTIYIDNTAPSLTITCTPVTPDEGQATTCTCTGRDATVGMNDTGTNFYGYVLTTSGGGTGRNPSTASAGTYTLICTAQDKLKNTAIKTHTLIVSDIHPGEAGGGGAAAAAPVVAWTSTRSITNEEFTQGYTKQLAAKNRLKVAVEGTNHFVGVLSLTGTTATIEVSSTPQQATLSVGDVRRFDVTGDGSYDVQVTLNGIADNKADVTVKSISEIITPATEEEEVAKETAAAGEEVEVGKPLLKSVWFWIVVIVVVLVIVYVVYRKKR